MEKDSLLCPVAGVYLSVSEALQALNDRLRGTENMQLVVETEQLLTNYLYYEQ